MAKTDHPTPVEPAVANEPALTAPPAAGTTAIPDSVSRAVGIPAGPTDDSLVAFINPDAVPLVILVLLCAVILVRVVNSLLARLSETMVKRRLLIKQAGTLTAFGIYLLAALVAASSLFNFSSQAIFALSGTLAVIAGFAFKDFGASLLASFTILVTRPFQVGDRISFGNYYGEVKDIGLRSVQLVTLDDSLVTIPSSKLLVEAVASANAGALDCMVVMPFYVSTTADPARAKEIIHDALLASRYLYLGKSFVVLTSIELIPDQGVVVKLTAKAYVYDARHEKAFAGDVTEMVLEQFRAEGIDMPRPMGAELGAQQRV